MLEAGDEGNQARAYLGFPPPTLYKQDLTLLCIQIERL